ncbi:MAG: O-antigen ligase family protein [Patescibacteria group bacterium]
MNEKNILNKYQILLFSFFVFIPILFLFQNDYIISVIILSSVLFFFLLFLKIEIGLYLMAIFLPFIEPFFSFKSLELPIVDLISLFILLAFFVREFYLFLYNGKSLRSIKMPFGIYFFSFFFICLLSSFFSHDIISSLWYSFRWILFFYLAFVVLPYNLIDSFKKLKKVIVLISILGFLGAVMGLVSLLVQDWSDSFFRVTTLQVFGNWIFGSNYNLLAEFLIASSFVILSLKFWIKSLRGKRLVNVLCAFLLLMVFLSFGRTAWITMFLQLSIYSIIYFSFIYEKKINRRVFILPFIALIFIALPFIVKMVSLQEANISSTQNRMLLTTISIDALKDKPMLGYGSGNFVHLVSDNIRFVAKYGDPLDSHGFIQKVLAENGLLGFISFSLFLFMIFRYLYRGLVLHKEFYQLLLPLTVAAFGSYFYQIFNTSYYKGRVWLFISLALVAVYLVENYKKNKLNERK